MINSFPHRAIHKYTIYTLDYCLYNPKRNRILYFTEHAQFIMGTQFIRSERVTAIFCPGYQLYIAVCILNIYTIIVLLCWVLGAILAVCYNTQYTINVKINILGLRLVLAFGVISPVWTSSAAERIIKWLCNVWFGNNRVQAIFSASYIQRMS